MYIVALVELNKSRIKICLDNGTDFVLYKSEFHRLDLDEGSELSDEMYQDILSEILIPRCKKRGMHLLEKMDRSEANLREKLKEGGYPEDAIDVAIDYIKSYGYINDDRLARSYIRFYQSSRSKRRIKQDLLSKGIKSSTIDVALEEEFENDESELIEALLIKKHYDKENATYEEKAKMFRFLMGRGFGSDAINRVLR